VAVAVRVGVTVTVGVDVAVRVGVGVNVAVGVDVAVEVGDGVLMGVGDTEGVEVAVAVGVCFVVVAHEGQGSQACRSKADSAANREIAVKVALGRISVTRMPRYFAAS
jgi:hypothetical protein